MLAAEDAVALPWVIEARMGATVCHNALAHHLGLLPPLHQNRESNLHTSDGNRNVVAAFPGS